MRNIIFPLNFFHSYFSNFCVSDFFVKVNKNLSMVIELSFDSFSYVVVEVGFGKGDFLLEYAKANPSYQIIGIEKSLKLVKDLSKRLDFYNISNIRLIEAKADFAFYFLIPDNFVDLVIINFPDPWPKKSHISRRLVNHNFLKLIYPKLKNNSKIFVSTDVEDYKDFIIDSLKKVIRSGFSYKLQDVILGFWESNFSTKYLRKWLKQNKKIYSLQIVKM